MLKLATAHHRFLITLRMRLEPSIQHNIEQGCGFSMILLAFEVQHDLDKSCFIIFACVIQMCRFHLQTWNGVNRK